MYFTSVSQSVCEIVENSTHYPEDGGYCVSNLERQKSSSFRNGHGEYVTMQNYIFDGFFPLVSIEDRLMSVAEAYHEHKHSKSEWAERSAELEDLGLDERAIAFWTDDRSQW